MTPLANDWDTGATLLDTTQRKARYGVAYVRNVCAQYGVGFNETSPDEDQLGVDGTIAFGAGDTRVQVKCTSRKFTTRGPRHISLSIKSDWAAKWNANRNPAYVIIVQVPDLPIEWLDFDADYETLHRASAYWARIDKLPLPSPSSIQVNFKDRFTPEALRDWNVNLNAGYR